MSFFLNSPLYNFMPKTRSKANMYCSGKKHNFGVQFSTKVILLLDQVHWYYLLSASILHIFELWLTILSYDWTEQNIQMGPLYLWGFISRAPTDSKNNSQSKTVILFQPGLWMQQEPCSGCVWSPSEPRRGHTQWHEVSLRLRRASRCGRS